MSKVMSRSNPALRATKRAPTTPAAGPESVARAGSSRAVASPMLPPSEAMIRSEPTPRSPSADPRFPR